MAKDIREENFGSKSLSLDSKRYKGGKNPMTFKLTFGKYKGKTFEWIFFHDPSYVYWINDNDIQRKFSFESRSRFNDLVRRASRLKIPGLCPSCHERPITTMFFTYDLSGRLGEVDFNCDQCQPYGSTVSTWRTPSFAPIQDRLGTEILIYAIKDAYFRSSKIRMTQKRMEAFFNSPDNFENF